MKYEGRVKRRRKGVMERLRLSVKRVRRRGFTFMYSTFTHFLNFLLMGTTTPPTTTLDYFSKLPDCILSQVISMLSIKDEFKTRVLSKRWSTLFSPRTHLNFDVSNILGTDHELQQDGYLHIYHLHNNTITKHLDPTLCFHEFTYRVDQFLTNFQGTHIHSFLLSFPLNSKHTTLIDHWISFAISRGVERIDLLFCGKPYHYYNRLGPRYHFPFALFSKSNASSTIKHMHLQYIRFCNHPNYDFIPFTNLRSLRLERVKVDEILNTGLLSTCLLLEELSLIFCEFKPSLSKIVSSSLCHLQVLGYYEYSNNGKVIQRLTSLDCVKLTSLVYHESLDALSINTPALKFIHHSGPHPDNIHHVLSLLATLPQLEVLHLDIYLWVATSIVQITQPLKHLKELKFNLHPAPNESGLLWILTILQACPLLQKLSIMFSPELLENEEDIKEFETFSHDELKVIEMGGCVGNWYEMEFATNILKCVHKLERIVISPYWRWGASYDWEYDPVWYQNGRERILEKLKKDEHNLYLYDCNSNPVWYQNGCEIILEKLQGRAQLILV